MSYGKNIIFVRLSLVTPLYCCDKTLLSRQQECRDKVYYVEVAINVKYLAVPMHITRQRDFVTSGVLARQKG